MTSRSCQPKIILLNLDAAKGAIYIYIKGWFLSRTNSDYHQEVQSTNSILADQMLKAVISITSSLGPFLLPHHHVVA